MNTAILRMATQRSKCFRRWDGLYLAHDKGHVSIRQERGFGVFWWNFHDHHGGRGGSVIHEGTRDEVKERIRNLFKQQVHAKFLGRKTILG